MNKIVIASNNTKKIEQMRHALSVLGSNYEIVGLKDIGYAKEIIEDGKTFEENSLKKAMQIYNDTGYIAIADDSGLCVDAMNGAPGVYTARYAGENATRKEKLEKMLDELKDVKDPNRTAKFVCVISCVISKNSIIQTRGELNGKISTKIVNIEDGLTQDPIFIPEGSDKTMSQFTTDEKLAISHRGKAIRKFVSEFVNKINY
ncbi:non-canonical purine NTP pyrophosphatase [Bacilli bacterium]|nr:non-canonical purine NTP pyrophosphatase [Bacilli bacterium]GHU52004.1 non-canonical purine NTP pyrophosphatase [Bacilli bacterium]